MHRLRRFLSLERKDRHLVLEAVVRLSLARLAVAGVPFRRLASTLGRHRAESSRPPGPDQRQEVKRVAWAVDAVGTHLPWHSTCLTRAVAGQWMLRRRKLPATLYLGTTRDTSSGELLAHAWLQSGEQVLLGEAELDRGYSVVSSFAGDQDPPTPSVVSEP